jgi:hypothetical protein
MNEQNILTNQESVFKKKPFKSIIFKKSREIESFFTKESERVEKFYSFYNKNLFINEVKNLEELYWFLLFQLHLKKDIIENGKEIINFVGGCEIIEEDSLGFKESPNSLQPYSDLWSTYYALAILNLIGKNEDYFNPEKINMIQNYVLRLKKNLDYLHCIDNKCEICKKNHQGKNLFYVLEIYTLLGIDVRLNKSVLNKSVNNIKNVQSIFFKLLCFKYLSLEYTVSEKEIEYIQQFLNIGDIIDPIEEKYSIDLSFWLIYSLDVYSWLFDYNPVSFFSYINQNLNKLLKSEINWNREQIYDISKLVICLSIIWKKFFQRFESTLFKQLERENFVDFFQISIDFDLIDIIDEVIEFLNLNYKFELVIVDNEKRFLDFLGTLSADEKLIAPTIYNLISKKNKIAISEIQKEFISDKKNDALETPSIENLIQKMIDQKFLKGKLAIKKSRFSKSKLYLNIEKLFKKIIVSFTNINSEHFFDEKRKVEEIKKELYNMYINLELFFKKIPDEVESYLMLEEINYAKERLELLISNFKTAVDIFNNKIENYSNFDFSFIKIQTFFAQDISFWEKKIGIFTQKAEKIKDYFQSIILKKEQINYSFLKLEQIEESFNEFSDKLDHEISNFRELLRENFIIKYSDEAFILVSKELEKIKKSFNDFNEAILRDLSIISTEKEEIIEKKKTMNINWLEFKEKKDILIKFYQKGLDFFTDNLNNTNSIEIEYIKNLNKITERIKILIRENRFQEAFNIIKKESNQILGNQIREINSLQESIKLELKSKQTFYYLYQHLQKALNTLEDEIIVAISNQVESLEATTIKEKEQSEWINFDKYVSERISNFKEKLKDYNNSLDKDYEESIQVIIRGYDEIRNSFSEENIIYLKKMKECKHSISDFEDRCQILMTRWENFENYLDNEITNQKEEFINNIIQSSINSIINKEKTNLINITELTENLNVKSKFLTKKIEDMINSSQINAKLNEDNKILIIFTDDYYRSLKLRSFIEKRFVKIISEKINKLNSLYLSSIDKGVLQQEADELIKRIEELEKIKSEFIIQFDDKSNELQFDRHRREFMECKSYLENYIKHQYKTLVLIKNNLEKFNSIINNANQLYQDLVSKIMKYFDGFIEKIEKDSYNKIVGAFENKKKKFRTKLKQTELKIEELIKQSLYSDNESKKLESEVNDLILEKKDIILSIFENMTERIGQQIIKLVNELFQEKLQSYLNSQKDFLNQNLNDIPDTVLDYIKRKDFKKAAIYLLKITKKIEKEQREANLGIEKIIDEFKNYAKDYRYYIEEFNIFLKNFSKDYEETIRELERLILKFYINMVIKAVANQFITISFINNELNFKREDIQDDLIFLISEGHLAGKYDPILGLYYENPEIVKNLDKKEIEAIQRQDLRTYKFLTRFKNFTKEYSSIIAFIGSLITISYYLVLIIGGNVISLVILSITVFSFVSLLIVYMLIKKRRGEKI